MSLADQPHSSESTNSDLRALEPNELVRRALVGCQHSFGELVSRYRPRLLQFLIRRMNGSLADAEDVTQETFARILKNLARFDSRQRFSTWLYTIALRLACDHDRKRRREHNRLETLQQQWTLSETSQPLICSEFEEPNVWTTAREVLCDIQYMAIWLRYGEDLSIAEIAQVMRRTKVGVRVILYRAKCILLASIAFKDSVDLHNSLE